MTKADDYDGWTFLKADKDIGTWAPRNGSPNTEESYSIGVVGSWVPTIDAGWLLRHKKHCACGNGKLIQMFAQVRPSADQMKLKPDHTPRLKKQSPTFGLSRVGGN